MNWTLEVIVIPVSDVDRARAFYAEGLGFKLDHDTRRGNQRIVQLTPPGSGCSIVFGTGLAPMEPGSLQGVQLVVNDLRAAHAELVGRGIEVGPVQVMGEAGMRLATDNDALNFAGFIFFKDPDGNGWTIQQIDARA